MMRFPIQLGDFPQVVAAAIFYARRDSHLPTEQVVEQIAKRGCLGISFVYCSHRFELHWSKSPGFCRQVFDKTRGQEVALL